MIIIRNIQPEDYIKTGNMIKRTLRKSFQSLYSQQLIEAFCSKYDLEKFKIKASQVDYFIAQDTKNKSIVGIIGLKNNELRTFFVDPKYQGQSIGTKLYNKLEQEAKKRGLKKLVLEGSPLGAPIYKHFGFKKLGEITKERNGISFVDSVMEKIIL